MPKILRIVNRFNLGGPTYNAAYLSRFLPDEYETLLVGGVHEPDEESSTFILDRLGITYRQLPNMVRSIRPKQDREVYLEILELIREFKPDIVHTHASKAGAIGRMAALKAKVPVVVHTFHGHVFHSYFGRAKTSFYKSLERRLAKRSSAIIAISNQQALELSEIYRICPKEKIQIINLGFELERFSTSDENKRNKFRSRFALDENTVAVGIIGRLAPIKNHPLFLGAFSRMIQSEKINAKAFIIGDGETRHDLEQCCEELGLNFGNVETAAQADVVFCGWIKDIAEALPGLDVVALSSLNEGTPVSLIEAQASGVPVVSTDVGGVRDIMLSEKSGFIAPSEDEISFSQHLTRLCQNESLRKEMGSAGKAFVLEKFHFTRMVEEHDRLYKKLLAR